MFKTISASLLLGLFGLATAQAAPAAATKPLSIRVAVPSQAISTLGIEVGRATGSRLVGCPGKLGLSAQALCLDAPKDAASIRSALKSKLSGEWKVTGKASSLLVNQGGGVYLVLLAQLSDKETLVVIDQPRPRAAMPKGAVKGQPYLLGSDLAGLVKVTNLTNGEFRLERSGQPALTLTAGKTMASLGNGSVELPLAPVSDGKNLLLPFSALRALGCTATPNEGVITVACGTDSVGIKPIIF